MKRRIFLSLIGLCLLSVLLYTVLVRSVSMHVSVSSVAQRMQADIQALRQAAKQEGGLLSALQHGGYANRITWIDATGRVLYDNRANPQTMGNHLNREEVAAALQTGEGQVIRRSATLDADLLYFAQKLDDGSVLRLASPAYVTRELFARMLPWLLFGMLLITLISALLAGHVTRALLYPLQRINPERPEEAQVYDELTPLLARIHEQNAQVRQNMLTLNEKQREMDALLNGMSEGFLVLDLSHRIVTINRSAARMLKTDGQQAMHKTLGEINRKGEILQLLEELDRNGAASCQVEIEGRTYQLSANRVDNENVSVILMRDMTERIEGENMRKRFSANVSHELRTPLTTICGYSEMLTSGMVRPEDEKDFLGRISNESHRLLALIEDILRLSKLDEGYPGGQHIAVDLLESARQAANSLEGPARKKNVTLQVEGEHLQVTGDPTLISELIFNLTDNAIKYNKPSGKVTLRIQRAGHTAELIVTDTGIGIEPSQQSKIFERFYRTDKSRSKETGGTGLGLSIVKHSAEYHHATLKVNSAPGKGTAITVSFPLEQQPTA